MSTSNQHDRETQTPDVPMADGDPYRTPADVTAGAKRGWLASPVTWLMTAGVLAGVIITVALMRRSGVPEYVEDFGVSRAGPPIEDFYPQDIAESGAPAVVDNDPPMPAPSE